MRSTQRQIKCSRCGALNHVRALSSELSPLRDMQAKSYLTVDGNLTGIAR
ncbi:Com family DNA-binding transcriptional regulator [Pseudomonas coleopterorum]